jgi:hypothetical protein
LVESNITYLIPNRPNRFYKNRGWISGEILSNNKIQNQKKVFLNMINFFIIFVENKIQIKIVRIGLYLEKIHDLIIFIGP